MRELEFHPERFLNGDSVCGGKGPSQIDAATVAAVVESAQANALGVLGRLEHELAHRDLLARIRTVIALLARELVGGGGQRDVAGALVPFGLNVGAGEVSEEARDPLVVGGRPAGYRPKRRAADERVLRRLVEIVVIGKLRHAEIEARTAAQLRIARRRRHQHRALAGSEARLGLVLAPGVGEVARLLPRRQHRDPAHHEPRVEGEPRAYPVHAVALRREPLVVPRAHVLDQHPGLPGGGQRDWRNILMPIPTVTSPSPPRAISLYASGIRSPIRVPIRAPTATVAVLRSVPLGIGKRRRDRGQVLRIERLPGVLRQLPERTRRARAQHVGGGRLVHLDDVRRAPSAFADFDLVGEHLVVRPLEKRYDAVVVLQGVEARHEPVELSAERTAHPVPESNLFRRGCRHRGAQEKQKQKTFFHGGAASI